MLSFVLLLNPSGSQHYTTKLSLFITCGALHLSCNSFQFKWKQTPFQRGFPLPPFRPWDLCLCASSTAQILLKPRSLALNLTPGEEGTLHAWPENSCCQWLCVTREHTRSWEQLNPLGSQSLKWEFRSQPLLSRLMHSLALTPGTATWSPAAITGTRKPPADQVLLHCLPRGYNRWCAENKRASWTQCSDWALLFLPLPKSALQSRNEGNHSECSSICLAANCAVLHVGKESRKAAKDINQANLWQT